MKYLFVNIFILLLLPVFVTYAQVSADLSNSSPFIKTSPLLPEPLKSFTATLDDYSAIGSVTSIVWRVDGTASPESTNLRTINIIAPEAGKTVLIQAVLEFAGGRTQTVSKSVTPHYLDIIVEAQTRTPSFYLGRSLPSKDSSVNVTAILSDDTNPQNLIYIWKVNNKVAGGGSQRGMSKTNITTPPGSSFLISLEVTKLTGETIAKRTVSIPSVSPELHFYEKSSLYGMGNRSLSHLFLTGDSVTVQAEPYNLAIETYNSPDLAEWKINSAIVRNPNINPYEITLSAANQSLDASTIDFHVRNLKYLLQGARGQFKLNF